MKAIVYDRSIPGKLELREAEKPSPGKGEVLIRVLATSINAADYRSMKLGIVPNRRIYGADVAGIVEQIGEGVSRFAVGDEVMGDLALYGFGGFAEYTTAPEKPLSKKPERVSFEEAATVSLAGVTALQGIRLAGANLHEKRVLVYGAGGGVGTYAVQLAKYFGAHVTAVCGTCNIEQTRTLGADRAIDYTREDALANGERYDMILAINGKRKLREYCNALETGGTAIIIGGSLKQVFAALAFGFLRSGGGRRMCVLKARANAEDSAYLAGLIAKGTITPVIEKVVSLDEGVEAFRTVAGGHARGKVVIRVD